MFAALGGCDRSSREQQGQDSDNAESEQGPTAASDGEGRDGESSSNRGAAGSEGGRNEERSGQGEQAQTMEFRMTDEAAQANGQNGPESAGDLGPAGFLLPEGNVEAVRPRDFVLGRLAIEEASRSPQAFSTADELSGEPGTAMPERAAVIASARSFLESDEFSVNAVHPEERTRMRRTLAARWRAAESVRLGLPDSFADGRWRVPVRLLSRVGEAVGEIYVEHDEGSWYIMDVAIPFAELDTPRPDREFQPGRAPSSSGF